MLVRQIQKMKSYGCNVWTECYTCNSLILFLILKMNLEFTFYQILKVTWPTWECLGYVIILWNTKKGPPQEAWIKNSILHA